MAAIDFPASPTNGQVYAGWVYDSSLPGWRNVNTDTGIGTLNAMGLKNVVPSSITVSGGSATVNANGTVTFTNVTWVALNNVFTSTYTNYKIDASRIKVGGTCGIDFRFRTSGSDNSTSAYNWAHWIVRTGGTYQAYDASAASYGRCAIAVNASTEPTSIVMDVKSPALSASTTFTSQSASYDSSPSAFCSLSGAGFFSTSTAFDGVTFFSSSGTPMSGTINIYGYSN